MIFSDERIVGDDFAEKKQVVHSDLIHDLQVINTITGQFHASREYVTAVNNWRKLGEPPVPNHPKLLHYITRRRVHLYKLSMVAAIDRGGPLVLGVEDFNKALGWLVEAELYMPEIFRAGAVGADAKAQDEIYNYVQVVDKGRGVPEHKIVNFARNFMPSYAVDKCLQIMQRAMLIKSIAYDKSTGQNVFKALPKQDMMGMDLISPPEPEPPPPKPTRRV